MCCVCISESRFFVYVCYLCISIAILLALISLFVCCPQGMATIESLDPAAFAAYLKATQNTICGRHPIAVLLNVSAQTFGALSAWYKG